MDYLLQMFGLLVITCMKIQVNKKRIKQTQRSKTTGVL